MGYETGFKAQTRLMKYFCIFHTYYFKWLLWKHYLLTVKTLKQNKLYIIVCSTDAF